MEYQQEPDLDNQKHKLLTCITFSQKALFLKYPLADLASQLYFGMAVIKFVKAQLAFIAPNDW